ncbi:MAG: ribosome biogenesis GTPase YlqF [Candidatus Accumulibacter phosphatis]|jgi:ribosome biogenesis GTPase A|uniref:Ribosome biogenesis GTPase A n=1 Tax=Candidatus Accumulibacter contiguus TaxID=2954381 RepID=A0ABX1TFA4_9PROT|nr:ribosome biogenesis GTPase YlqF [Candidatus Accumulibacter contiguus]MBL8409291.1 ribosome biogenesis GTPase YlqF [Accumulibacter sp.]NMQ06912.1 ribosome biogenesis GTPase YlqF [Candidatus Accumulibacter contiguus]
MAIQWYPGHMTSARKKAAETMASIDVVIEVLDARLPEASTNPLVRELRLHRQRPCLKVLNKADLADPQVTQAWIAYYNRQEGVRAVALSCKKPGDVARLPGLCEALAPHRSENTKPLRMMIMGIPNVGKSTLMNVVLQRKLAKVGDEPAVTRAQQTSQLDVRHSITDTPGLLWPKIEHPSDGLMLAASHAVGRNAMIDEEVATFLAGLLLARYPTLLAKRYGFPADAIEHLDAVAVIEEIARRRSLRVRGGEADLEKAAKMLLQDYRDGVLGRISLETPLTRSAMLAAEQTQTVIRGTALDDDLPAAHA